MDPSNPNILYAASYQRRRTPWGFNGGGAGQRHLEDDRRRQDLDEADRQRPADQPDHRPHRPRHRALEAVRRSTRRSKSARAAAPAPASTTTARCVDPNAAARRRRRRRRRRGAARRRRPIRTSPASGARTMAGKTWRFLSNSMDRPMYYSQIRVDPDQPRDRLSGRRAVLQDDRRRQDVAPGAGARAQRPPRDLDRSARTAIT